MCDKGSISIKGYLKRSVCLRYPQILGFDVISLSERMDTSEDFCSGFYVECCRSLDHMKIASFQYFKDKCASEPFGLAYFLKGKFSER